MLNGAPILVAEDQPFIALDLALAVEDAGGEVVGPAASVAEAMALLASQDVAGAILDLDLADGECSAVIEALTGRRAPIIVQTGVGLPPGLAERFPALEVHDKPFAPAKIVAQLEAMLANARARDA